MFITGRSKYTFYTYHIHRTTGNLDSKTYIANIQYFGKKT